MKTKTLIVFFISYCNVFKITFVISTKEALACWGVKCKRPADKLFIKGAGDFTSNLIFHVVHNGIEVSWVGIVCSLIRTIQLSWNWRKQTIKDKFTTLSLLFSFILHRWKHLMMFLRWLILIYLLRVKQTKKYHKTLQETKSICTAHLFTNWAWNAKSQWFNFSGTHHLYSSFILLIILAYNAYVLLTYLDMTVHMYIINNAINYHVAPTRSLFSYKK